MIKEINESLYFAYPKIEEQWGFGIEQVSYASAASGEMLQIWNVATPDNYIGGYIRRSNDNGRTWGVSSLLHAQKPVPGAEAPEIRRLLGLAGDANISGYHQSFGNQMLFCDLDHDLLILVYYGQYSDFAGEIIQNGQLFYRLSCDHGLSWDAPRQIIQSGESYDERHWAKDVALGKVAGIVAGMQHMEKTADGTLLVPFQIAKDKGREIPFRQGVFLGRWRDDLSAIDWDMGEYVSVPRELSSRGVLAGSVAVLRDGRILLVMRSDSAATGLEGEVKLASVSADGGRSWSEAKPVTYANGETMWSSSSNLRLIRAEADGELYLVTHIREKPLQKAPRNPLAIARIDEETLTVDGDSVYIIKAPTPLDMEGAYYESRGIYNDRESGLLVMFVGNGNLSGVAQVLRFEVDFH